MVQFSALSEGDIVRYKWHYVDELGNEQFKVRPVLVLAHKGNTPNEVALICYITSTTSRAKTDSIVVAPELSTNGLNAVSLIDPTRVMTANSPEFRGRIGWLGEDLTLLARKKAREHFEKLLGD